MVVIMISKKQITVQAHKYIFNSENQTITHISMKIK